MRQLPTTRHANASSRRRSRRHRPRSRTLRHPIASARPEPARAPACSSAPCRRRRGDAGNWCAAGRSAHRGSCRHRRSRPRPAAAACRRRADSARCGIRRRHGAYRPRRFAPRRCATSRFRAAARPVAAIAGLCGGGDAKRRRQLRLIAGQRDRVERGSFAAGGGPDIGENFAGALHGYFSSLTLLPASPRMEMNCHGIALTLRSSSRACGDPLRRSLSIPSLASLEYLVPAFAGTTAGLSR